jgi:hypothetical protein
VAVANDVFDKIADPLNKAVPGGGGCHWEVGADGQKVPGSEHCTPLNNGQSLDILKAPLITGNFPGGPAYTGKEAPPIDPTDLDYLLSIPAALNENKGSIKIKGRQVD